ncbi:E3 ubiquitin-protein transferase Katazuke [Oratosquilla oratoria]|uniref:E3 ubiquitin-protein transferase Katazuke n=1 Tax=Oratosquilla oratoria TaxID=337810 RepID=UPI003F76DF84
MAAEITSLEHPTLKVPYEVLNKKFRLAQKTLDREVCHVTSAVSDLEHTLFSPNQSAAEISSILGGVVEKLTVFKRKAEEAINEEIETAKVVKRRIEHLKEHDSLSPAVVTEWKKTRVDRMLIEYLLRAGYYNTAIKLAKCRNLEGLTNMEVFLVARDVEKSLGEHDTSKCLAWCHDNKSKLRKLSSSLEFNVRLQEFIELIKSDQKMEAVKHARKHFAGQDPCHLPDIQKCMALIAFPLNTDISPYKELLSDSRWEELVEQFRSENLKLYQLSSQSAFCVVLQGGLSALKTPHCYRGGMERNPDCPACHEPLNTLAAPLPYAHCSQSRLVCHITGEPLNENNQPLMLPNGYVYGEKILQDLARENNGTFLCPRTKQTFNIKDAEKVFVM